MTASHPSLRRLIEAALTPVGDTLYVWAGGWRPPESCRIGPSPAWHDFFVASDASYDWERHRYEHGNGLDCSGYVSWVLYNTFNDQAGGQDFVCFARQMASSLAERGWGSLTEAGKVDGCLPGDVFSNDGHCWIGLGTCADGSVLLVHSSPPGVQVSGTPAPDGRPDSDAAGLAERIMGAYPAWSERYGTKLCDYLGGYRRFRWDVGVALDDDEGLQGISAEELAEWLGLV